MSRVSVEKSKNMGKGSKVKSQGSTCQGSKTQDLVSRVQGLGCRVRVVKICLRVMV